MQIKQDIAQRIERAFKSLDLDGPALVQAASRPEFGDYQANGVMAVAKRAKRNPKEVAQQVVDSAALADIASEVEVAGPGFLNITLKADYVASAQAGEVSQSHTQQTVVVDYSAPNLAKEMHVGHLRTTIIGDAIARVLEAQGHNVLRQNHVGDWGTQFGMLLTYLAETGEDSDELANLEDFYRAAKSQFDADDAFQTRARQAVVDLQAGDETARAQWQRFIDISMAHCADIYERLNITLTPAHTAGESSYNHLLPWVIEHLPEQGLLTLSDGAQCVFLDEFKTKKGDVVPVIVQKSDGGYLYATTDLAAVYHRTHNLNAQRILYFTDARQAFHFKQIFAVSEIAGFNVNQASLEHMPFGSMLGPDGKPFKTREGGVVKLASLLDEAIERAEQLLTSMNTDLGDAKLEDVAQQIGLGAIKYAELSKNRTSDYVFDWDQMLSFDGNTAPYMQYAYARICSIFRRGEVDVSTLDAHPVAVDEPERRLNVCIAGFNDVLEQVAAEAYPHFLCGYLYELASRFSEFYEACPILKSSEEVRLRRLSLAHNTQKTLEAGMNLLGIDVIERM